MTNVCVFGLWHLGCVTAACVADAGYQTIGIDPYPSVIAGLKQFRAPLFEPGLDDLIRHGMARSRLAFTDDFSAAGSCDLVWVTFDTPVDENDVADIEFVTSAVESVFPYLNDGAVLLISSQLPVGSTRAMAKVFEARYPQKICHLPIRRKICGSARPLRFSTNRSASLSAARASGCASLLQPLLENFTRQIVWMSIESAEMVKHGVNAFLATCGDVR